MSFWRRPQATLSRRILFQIHLWTGLTIATYAIFIGVTGAVLLFRPDLQARAYPRFFARGTAAPLADPASVLANLRRAFPGYRFSGIEYPTYRRGTFLAYLSRGDELKTVFADANDARVLGELPHDGWIQRLQDLHFNFRAGSTGYIVNGVAASCLLTMCVTGIVIWWPGVGRVAQAFIVHRARGWRRTLWELHGAVGIWAVVLLLVWSVSGIYFSFPVPFRAAIARVATLTDSPVVRSRPGVDAHVAPADLIERARAEAPGAQIARFVVPSAPEGTYAVVLARGVHGDWDASDEVTIYFDRYSGERLLRSDAAQRTTGDVVITWLGLLHVGSFGGWTIKIVWLVAALALPVLAATGFLMWWNRVIRRPRAARIRVAV